MKNVLVILLSCLGVAAGAAPMTISPVLGATSMSLKGSDISGSRGGLQAGAIVNFESSIADLHYETGLLYSQAGAKDDALLASVEYELNYLAVPLGVQYRLSGEDRSFWAARGGLTLAALMSAKAKSQVFGSGSETDIKDQTNTFDMLPYIGIVKSWSIGESQRLALDFTYTRGLMKVFKDQSSNTEGWTINLAYGFAF